MVRTVLRSAEKFSALSPLSVSPIYPSARMDMHNRWYLERGTAARAPLSIGRQEKEKQRMNDRAAEERKTRGSLSERESQKNSRRLWRFRRRSRSVPENPGGMFVGR